MAKSASIPANPSARRMGVTGRQALRAVMVMLGIAALAAFGAALLPDNPYQRWQLLEGSIHSRSRWIHERIHFDPTPIDVAVVGSSRFGAGISGPQLAAAMGLPEGRVVNFSLAESGRNLNALVVSDMYTTKRPRLLVIGVTEKPSRLGHNAFKYLAPAGWLVDPGHPVNLKWPSDLAYLPYRQLKLTAAWLFPEAMGLRTRFDPSRYSGSSIGARGFMPEPDNRFDGLAHEAELLRGVRKFEANSRPPLLPSAMADIEFGDERHYLRRILADARAHGTRVVFVALPYYTGPSTLQEQAFYACHGPLLNPHFVADDPALFIDYGHLNGRGTSLVTRWLGERLRAMMAAPQAPATSSCG